MMTTVNLMERLRTFRILKGVGDNILVPLRHELLELAKDLTVLTKGKIVPVDWMMDCFKSDDECNRGEQRDTKTE